MRLWHQIELTSAHRPVLFPGEVDILVQDGVGIYEGRSKVEGFQNGRIYLTTHRACYVDSVKSASRSVAVDLSLVDRIQFNPRLLRSSPKVSLFIQSGAAGVAPTVPAITTTPLSGVSRSATPDPTATVNWICPICSYSNSIRAVDIDGPTPACLTCGIKPAASVISAAKQESMNAKPGHVYAAPLPDGIKPEKGFVCPLCTFVNHPSLHQCEMCETPLISTNIPPALVDSAMKDLVLDPQYPDLPPESNDQPHVKISFRSGGERVFLEKLKVVLQERVWDRRPVHHTRQHSAVHNSVPQIGIHGLQTQQIKERQHNQELLQSLDDLESLMKTAKEMVQLAERFARRLQTAPGVPQEARIALSESSKALSLASPIVMREMAGGGDESFYAELARQLAEFLDTGVLRREGGILTLFDLYALYNHARGISLISPKDLYSACSGFGKLGLPFRLRKFKSGLVVVQESSNNDAATTRMLVDWVRVAEKKPFGEQDGVTAQEVSERFGWSVAVCVEELETAQDQGKLCSDAAIEGTRYFINIFDTYQWKYSQVDSLKRQPVIE